MSSYRPMTLADLAGHLSREGDVKLRWKLVWEFMEEYRWEPQDNQASLLQDEPSPIGDERWDTLPRGARRTLGRTAGPGPAGVGRHASPGTSMVPSGAGHPASRCAGMGACRLPQAWRLPLR
jgi:hypothetical protein